MMRRGVLKLLGAGAIAALGAEIFRRWSVNLDNKIMPTLFLGHGSPMNAVSDNEFTRTLNRLGENLPKPKAILVISAHWLTQGTWVTRMENPKTIHDFYGFPQELFEIQYPAPGQPALADQLIKEIAEPKIYADDREWGLDHGTWSVLKHLYPKADVPVIQMSIDASKPNEYHFEMGKRLQHLREQGVLVVGSGNIVHNLGKIKWDPTSKPHDWALEFDEWAKHNIQERNFNALVQEPTNTSAGKLSIPTPDHYWPLMYVLGVSKNEERLQFDFEGVQNASISMRCVRFG